MNGLIKTIREKSGTTQEQFAMEIKVTALSVHRWETGKTLPEKTERLRIYEFCQNHNIDISEEIEKEIQIENSSGDQILYHGSKKGISGTIKPISHQHCDYGKGFYLGTTPLHPLTLICSEFSPILYTVRLNLKDLKVLQVPFSIEWALLIAYHRGYMEEAKGSMIYKKYETLSKGYDVIQGCIADDRMYKVMKSFFEKEITDVALFKSLSALDLGTQYVLKTQKACD